MNLSAWLIAMVGPLVARVLVSLGVTLVTLTGATVALGQLSSSIHSAIGGLPADAMALGGILGAWEALGIAMGAITFSVTWRATTGFIAVAKA